MGIFDKFRKSTPVYDEDGHKFSSIEEYVASDEYRDSKIPDAMSYLQQLESGLPPWTNSRWDDFFSGIEEVESMFLKGTALTKEQDDFRKESIKKTSEIIENIPEYSISGTMEKLQEKNPYVNTEGIGTPDPIVLYITKQIRRFFILTEGIGGEVKGSVHSQKLGIKKVSDLFWNKTQSSDSNLQKYLDAFIKNYPDLPDISKRWSDYTNSLVVSAIRNQPYFVDFVKLYDLIISKGIMMSIPMFVRLLVSRYFDKEWKEFEDNILNENPKEIEDFIKAFMKYYYDSWKERLDDFKTVLKQSNMPSVLLQHGITFEGIEFMIQDFQRNTKREAFEESLLSGHSGTKITDLDELGGIEFENFLLHLFEKMGYQCEITKGSGDQGADLLIKRMGKKTVVQAKRYNGKVSNSAIQESTAAVKYYNADNAMVVTTNYFTKDAASLADSNNVKLIDRNKLEEWLKQYQI